MRNHEYWPREFYYAQSHAWRAIHERQREIDRLKANPNFARVKKFMCKLNALSRRCDYAFDWCLYTSERLEEKYRADQPRVPAGKPAGGQWTVDGNNSAQGAEGSDSSLSLPDDHINTADGAFIPIIAAAAAALASLPVDAASAVASFLTERATLGEAGAGTVENETIQAGAQAVEDFLGGPAERVINNDGNMVFMRGDRKLRFDLNPRVGDPHFQLEIFGKDKYGNPDWIDAIPGNHQFPFRDK